jgi:hypothetical protein
MASRVLETVDKTRDAGQLQTIKHLESTLFIRENPRFPQHRKMSGNRAPAQPAGFHQLAYALLAAPAQLPHDLDSRRVRQSPKDFVG